MRHLTRKLELASDIPRVIVVRGDFSRKVSKYDLLAKINLSVERFTNPSEEYRSYLLIPCHKHNSCTGTIG